MNELQVENPELAGKAERSRAASRAPGWLRLRTKPVSTGENQAVTENPGMNSATVGTSGKLGSRFVDVTASGTFLRQSDQFRQRIYTQR
jgi:hypothetical protein